MQKVCISVSTPVDVQLRSIMRQILKTLHDYVPGKSIEEVRQEYGLEAIIKLASNENPLGPSPKAVEAIKDTAEEVFRYPLGDSPELAKFLTERLGLKKSNVCFGNGSDEVIWLLSTVFLNPGDEVISSQPTFSEYAFCTQLLDGVYKEVPLQDFCHETKALLGAITEKTKIIYLCNPNNPTGTWVEKEEMREFLKAVPAHIQVVVDQAYCEYAQTEAYPQLIEELAEFPNLTLLRTFSKVYGLAGMRIGYALANESTISAMMKVKQPFNVNLLAQKAALAALQDNEHMLASIAVNQSGLEKLTSGLDSLGLEYLPTVANFLAVKLGPQAGEVVKWMESKGLIIRWLKSFGLKEWVRITISFDEDMQLVLDLLEEWKNVRTTES